MDGNDTRGWRLRCPRGHVRLRRRQDGRYYCRSCAVRGVDPYYAETDLRDAR